MSEVFSLQEVSYQYKAGAPAMKDVTLSIQEGERVALLGANGSGKSTLLMVMAGLITPTERRGHRLWSAPFGRLPSR